MRAFEQFAFRAVILFDALFAFVYAPEDYAEFAFVILLFSVQTVTHGACELASRLRLEKGLIVGRRTLLTVLCVLILALAVAMANFDSQQPRLSAIQWAGLVCAALSVYGYAYLSDAAARAARKPAPRPRKRAGKRAGKRSRAK